MGMEICAIKEVYRYLIMIMVMNQKKSHCKRTRKAFHNPETKFSLLKPNHEISLRNMLG